MQSTHRSMATGALWMVLFKFSERGLGLLSTLILVRLLAPADFGVVAMAMSFVALLELLAAFGFDVALIRNQGTDRKDYDTAWTLNVLLGAGVALLMVALSKPLSTFYREPALSTVIALLAIGSAVQGFENIGVVAFRKNLEFAREFRYLVAKKIAQFAITIPLAFALRNFWALVFGILAGRIASVILSYWVHPYRPRFSLAARGDLLHFSKWLLVNNALNFLRERASDFVIGRAGGARSLGIFNVSYEIANLPTTELVMPINRAVFPAYARLAADRDALRLSFAAVIGVIALFAVPAGTGIAALAELLTHVVLGPKWMDGVPAIEMLAFFGVTIALQTNSYSVYLALGKPHLQACVSLLFLAVLIPGLLWFTSHLGVRGAATAFLLAGMVILPANYAVALRHLQLPAATIVRALWRPILASAVMFFAVRALVDFMPGNEFVRLLAGVATGVVAYLATLMLLWRLAGGNGGAERAILDRCQEWLSARRAPPGMQAP
jgi:O-antigen/teichoic acid export membrane protein